MLACKTRLLLSFESCCFVSLAATSGGSLLQAAVAQNVKGRSLALLTCSRFLLMSHSLHDGSWIRSISYDQNIAFFGTLIVVLTDSLPLTVMHVVWFDAD